MLATHVVCINIDGMDQSKFRIPRVAAATYGGSTSKLFQRLFRPVLHVTGAWCHGHRLNFWIMDEDVKKDSSAQQEVLSRTLSDVFNQYGTLPAGLVIQQDNTYREGKNRYFLSHMILLVAIRCFRFCICNYLRVGHSVVAELKVLVLVAAFLWFCVLMLFSRLNGSTEKQWFANKSKAMKTWIKLSHSKQH